MGYGRPLQKSDAIFHHGMDFKFQSSFIPKQPLNVGDSQSPGHISIFYLTSLVAFIVTLGLAGAAFIGERIFESQVEKLNQELIQTKSSFELSTIGELKVMNNRIDAAKHIVDKHLSFSKFFDYLNTVTYKNISFSDFSYTSEDSGALTLKIKGIAASFNSLMLQEELLQDSDKIKNLVFTDFKLEDDGKVDFSLSASVDQSFVLYKNYLIGANNQ
jgi:hypothetical protein